MKNLVQVYNNHRIAFHLSNENSNVMINATQMAKLFNRLPNDFLRLESTKRFISAYESDTSINRNVDIQLVRTAKGGNINEVLQGTWFHEDLALKFAAWLNPHFEIWMLRKVKELLKTGSVSVSPNELSKLEILQMAVESEKNRLKLEQENQVLQNKANMLDKISNTKELVDIGQAAKILNLPYGRNTLFQKLRSLNIFFKHKNEPLQQYINKGLFRLVEKYSINRGRAYLQIFVTQKGLQFLDARLNNI